MDPRSSNRLDAPRGVGEACLCHGDGLGSGAKVGTGKVVAFFLDPETNSYQQKPLKINGWFILLIENCIEKSEKSDDKIQICFRLGQKDLFSGCEKVPGSFKEC